MIAFFSVLERFQNVRNAGLHREHAIDRPLYPAGIIPEGHTHAYDHFCSPMLDSEEAPAAHCASILWNTTQVYETMALTLWSLLVVAGAVVCRLDPQMKWEATLRQFTVSSAIRGIRDVVLPPNVVGVITIVGLLTASVFGCFVYYPPSEHVLRELSAVNAETCSRGMSGDTQGALHWIPVYEDLLKKLEVGIALRGGRLTKEQSIAIATIEETLEVLEHAMNDAHRDEGRTAAKQLAKKYMAFRKSMD